MDLTLSIKDVMSLIGLVGSLVSFSWYLRGQMARMTITMARVDNTLDTLEDKLADTDRKANRGHQRVDDMAEKVTKLEVKVEQLQAAGAVH
ncbi:MAG TPA: hypothetical protein EYN66_14455 [Myxococcales bacterium]|nr:hypothetical protein [Myxococcales bacterium]